MHYINTFGQDKVIFGTDFPVLDFERTRAEIEALGLQARSRAEVPARQRDARLQARLNARMIALEITPELAEVRTALRRFTTEKLEPLALEIDRTGEVPQAASTCCASRATSACACRRSSAAAASTCRTYCLALEEFSRSHRVFTLLLDAHAAASRRSRSRASAPTHRRRSTSPASPTAR